jgi:hypothetical protein
VIQEALLILVEVEAAKTDQWKIHYELGSFLSKVIAETRDAWEWMTARREDADPQEEG